MNEVQRAKLVLKILDKTYPNIEVPLKSRNVFTLLISVLLSAQCTDVNVNNVTKNIYPKFYKPEHFVKLGKKRIEILIKKIGIFRVKAKSIYNLSKILIRKYEGKVPKSFEELEQLPGVGHKTASVVMSQGFGFPAFPNGWASSSFPSPSSSLALALASSSSPSEMVSSSSERESFGTAVDAMVSSSENSSSNSSRISCKEVARLGELDPKWATFWLIYIY
mgnify:CR=1 FL=1